MIREPADSGLFFVLIKVLSLTLKKLLRLPAESRRHSLLSLLKFRIMDLIKDGTVIQFAKAEWPYSTSGQSYLVKNKVRNVNT